MESDLSYLLILFGCFIFSAIFSAAETALTTIPEAYVRQIIESKRGLLGPFKLWLNRPNRVLTTIIVGNNLVNTLAAVVATIYAQKLFNHYVISISTTAVTLALLIFGEITPKTFARHNSKIVTSWVMYIIYPLYFLLFPAVWVLSHLAVFLVHLGGGRTKRVGPMATEEDIAYLIHLSQAEGVFKKDQGTMLQSVIAFRDTAAREVMVPRTDISSFNIDTSHEEIMNQVALHGYTRWPVYTDDIDHVVGILYVKDLLGFHFQSSKKFVLKNIVRPALFVPDSMKLDSVLREFQRKKVHMAIIVDEYGGTAGVVTLEDLLEEIVGEIRDEYDKEDEEVTVIKLGEDHFMADGKCNISDLKKQTGINLPDDESYDTLGGFLMATFGKIPRKDEELIYDSWKFRISEVEEKRIIKVEITASTNNSDIYDLKRLKP